MYEIKEIVLTSGTGVLEFKIQYCTVCICICMLCVCVFKRTFELAMYMTDKRSDHGNVT